MVDGITSAGVGFASCSAEQTGLAPLPQRAGHLRMADLIDLYMQHYVGRDPTRMQRLGWWSRRLGSIELQALSDDDVHAALEDLERQRGRYFAGNDADGRPIFKAKARPISPATVNRYCASLAAVLTFAIKRRIAPRGFVHPCRSVERKPESSGRTRFLSDAERTRLLDACKPAPWPRLYLLVLMALTTGARKGELLGLTWADVDRDRGLASVGQTKNGDPRMLPLVAAVLDELARFTGAPDERVFRATRRAQAPHAFEEGWKDALVSAGIRGFRFHDLRHSCASLLARAGATLLEIGDLLGHRQISMTKRYSHLTTGHKSALVDRVLGGIK